MKTKENGITLVALVIMIVLLVILASIGYTVGNSTISSVRFTQFKNELKVMQTKVNELNQENKTNIGQELTEAQKGILDILEISNIIYDGKTEEKTKIKNGFKYFSKDYINETFDLEGVSRDYLINIEYRYVVFPEGFIYEGNTYYMINQIYGEIYNVQYNNKNEKVGDFDVVVTKEDNRCKVEIANIQDKYNGYVDKWQVKYKLEDSSYWKTSDNLTFYVRDEGTYLINVVHGDEIDLGTKSVKIFTNGLISDKVKSRVIKIGDYVQYTPDTAGTDSIIEELGTYSGNTDSTKNTTGTIQQESLNWRVLDINDDGEVRLISELPTTSKIALKGYNGYNNAVYLLDKTCKTLYSKAGYAENIQNLKIEDIQKYMKIKDYSTINSSYGTTDIIPINKKYPSIFEQEEGQTITGVTQPETRLGISEQVTPINQTEINEAESWTVKYTYWGRLMEESDFTNSVYYNLFINNGSNYSTYWMSSRCVDFFSIEGNACVYFTSYCVYSGRVDASILYQSSDTSGDNDLALRPVITLNSNVLVKSGEGTSTKPYEIGL